MLNQHLWINRHITAKVQGSKTNTTLYFKEWLQSDNIFVNDLKFVQGELDENFVYEHVKDKRNIYVQIMQLRKDLKHMKDF